MELAPTTEKETPWKQGKLGDFLKISLFDAYTTHCKYDYNSLFLLFQAPFVIIFNLTISSRWLFNKLINKFLKSLGEIDYISIDYITLKNVLIIKFLRT